MIDVESQIYTPIAEALRVQFPGILVSGEYVNAPTRFPYVSLVEQDNYTTEAHMDSGDMVGWEIPAEYVDIFSNLVIIGAVLMVSCKYIAEAFTKFKAILDATKEGKSYDEIK